MEQAGSMLKTLIASCLPCIWSENSEQAPRHQMHNTAIEREMTVNHSQPHLVPPMKLVLYETLPDSQRVDSRSSVMPQWISEGRNLASKASNRASLTLRPGTGKQSRKLDISGPSDFRKVSSQRHHVAPFQPLELSIHLPGNQLPTLPEFESFDLNNSDELVAPPKALLHTTNNRRFSEPRPSSFNVPRKPVGSSSRRSSVTSGYMQVYDRRRTLPDISGSLSEICEKNKEDYRDQWTNDPSTNHRYAVSENVVSPQESQSGNGFSQSNNPVTNDTTSQKLCSSIPPPPSSPLNTSTSSRLVTQWLFRKSQATDSSDFKSPLSPRHKPSSSIHSRGPNTRSRTLSGSTMVSLTNAYSGVNSRRSPSISSSITATPPRPSSSFRWLTNKDYETNYDSGIENRLPSHFEGPCPTVYEKDQNTLVRSKPYYNETLETNNVGLAF